MYKKLILKMSKNFIAIAFFLLIGVFLHPYNSFANIQLGQVTVKGKLVSYDKNYVVLKQKTATIKILRKEMNLEGLIPGKAMVALNVYPSDIESVNGEKLTWSKQNIK